MATTSKGFRYPVSTDTPNVPRDIGYLASDVDNWITNNPITINGTPVTLGGTVSITGLPTQTGNNGKYLTTDGSTASWATIDLSSYLTTANAASTYLTISNAASTYLTTSSASTTYAAKASPTFTGTPLAPTATAGTNTTQIATTAFVSTAVSNLVNSAPAALDTLNELAAALGNDASFSTTVTNSIAGKVSKSGGDTITPATISTVGLTLASPVGQTGHLLYAAGGARIPAGGNYFIAPGISASYTMDVTAGASNIVPMTVKGATSQTANLQEWQDSSGSVLASITSTGIIDSAVGRHNTLRAQGGSVARMDLSSGSQNIGITTAGAGYKGLVITGTASQTANLTEWQNSAGTVLNSVNNGGSLTLTNAGAHGIGGLSAGVMWYIVAGSSGYRPLVVQAAASQTGNLTEWQNSSGTSLAKVDKDGNITAPSLILSTTGLATTSGGTGITSYTTGDIVYASATNTLSKLGVGSNGQILTLTGGLPTWANAPTGFTNPMTAAGDIIIGGTSGAATRLAAGTNGYVLTMSSGSPAWVAATAGYTAPTIGSTSIASGSTVTTIAGLTLTSPIINPSSASAKSLIVKGAVSQTANLQEWQDNSGNTLLSVSSDGVLNKTGITYIGPQLWFADPGVGNETKFQFVKQNDGAWLTVKERAADQTYYEFGMSDNALDGGDYFQWSMAQWAAPGYGWMPLQLGTNSGKPQTLRFTGEQSLFWSNLSTPVNSPFYTYLDNNNASANYEVTKWTPANDINVNLRRLESTGSSATFNVDLSGYTYTGRMGYRVTIDSGATTFSYSTYGGDNSSGSAIAITAGSWQTLSNGTKIKIGTGALAGENWSFLAFPTPRVGIGGALDTSALTIIRPAAADKGLIIKAASGQTANLQGWQNSGGSETSYIDSSGAINTSGTIIQIGGTVLESGAIIRPYGASSTVTIKNNSSTTAPSFIVKSTASQTANLQEWQNSAGSVMASIGPSGTTTWTGGSNIFTGDARVGTNSYFGGALSVYSRTTSEVGLVVRAQSSQTANLQEWQISSGTTKSSINASGQARLDRLALGSATMPSNEGELSVNGQILLSNLALTASGGYLYINGNQLLIGDSPQLTGTPSASNLTLTGTLTAGGSAGTNGQVLQSTGTGIKWSSPYTPDLELMSIMGAY